jgi:hypothetical protein
VDKVFKRKAENKRQDTIKQLTLDEDEKYTINLKCRICPWVLANTGNIVASGDSFYTEVAV